MNILLKSFKLQQQSMLWWHELLKVLDADESDDLYDMYQDTHYYMECDVCQVYIASDKSGELMGMAIVIGSEIPEDSFVHGDERFTGSVCLEQIYTMVDHRSKGVGTYLMRAILKDHPNISLTVRETNPAVNLYLELGFVINDRIQSFYPKSNKNIGSESALVMYRNTNMEQS